MATGARSSAGAAGSGTRPDDLPATSVPSAASASVTRSRPPRLAAYIASSAARARLIDAGVIVRDLPGTPYVRASVGAWNDSSDIERLLAAL